MTHEYVPGFTPPAQLTEPALWFAFRRAEIIVLNASERPAMPSCTDLSDHGVIPLRKQYLGLYAGQHCFAAEVSESQLLPENWATLGLRDLFGLVETTLAGLSGRAYQIIDWDRNHQFCSRCGKPTEQRQNERSRACPSCGFVSYPPVSPAIMVLVTHGRRLLLARKAAFPAGRYSALAGFVEPGETLEATAVRETREEVGVEISNIRYFGSQPWPFPHSLMIAFTAAYAGGDVTPDGVEIEEARWFEPDQLPKLPPPISISRRMIDAVSAQLLKRTS